MANCHCGATTLGTLVAQRIAGHSSSRDGKQRSVPTGFVPWSIHKIEAPLNWFEAPTTHDPIRRGDHWRGRCRPGRCTSFAPALTVLEASHRAGGRAHTIVHDKSAIDLGAGWLHHGHKNSLLPLANAQNATVSTVGMESFDSMHTAFDFESTCALFDTALEDAVHADRDEPASQFLNMDHPQAAAAAYWMCNIDMGTDPQKPPPWHG